jgi:hypothetical protein
MAAYFKPTRPEYELVADDESEPSTPQPSRSRRTHVAMASVLLCAAGAAFAVVAPSAPLTSLDEEGAAAGLTLGVTNEYGALASVKFYPWAHLAEAHKVRVCAGKLSHAPTIQHWLLAPKVLRAFPVSSISSLALRTVDLISMACTFGARACCSSVCVRLFLSPRQKNAKLYCASQALPICTRAI